LELNDSTNCSKELFSKFESSPNALAQTSTKPLTRIFRAIVCERSTMRRARSRRDKSFHMEFCLYQRRRALWHPRVVDVAFTIFESSVYESRLAGSGTIRGGGGGSPTSISHAVMGVNVCKTCA